MYNLASDVQEVLNAVKESCDSMMVRTGEGACVLSKLRPVSDLQQNDLYNAVIKEMEERCEYISLIFLYLHLRK